MVKHLRMPLGELLELVRWYMGVLNKGTLTTNLIHNLTINISCDMLYLLKYLEDILMSTHEANTANSVIHELSNKQTTHIKQGNTDAKISKQNLIKIQQKNSNKE